MKLISNNEPAVDLQLAFEHGLTEEEYSRIKSILGRVPNFTELGIFSVMWSEHCSYKSSREHLKKFPTKGPRVLQGPGENAGAVDIGDGYAVIFKMESHNHPSYIEPYQGAATGVGGILRDIFTMGARPIASMNSLRFGSPSHPKTAFLVNGVVGGIAGYGNCMGIPTVGGEIYFDDSYDGNILVNVFSLGLVEKDRIFKGYASGIGNPVIYVGSKTGKDGIHGASLLASAEFDDETEDKRPTVQVGDPFTEKLLLEACLEVMKTDCVVGIQDMGAAGLTCSSVEMADRAGTGLEIDLALVPLRERDMIPYECMLSESQERMLLVAHKGREQEVIDIYKKWDLDAVVIGLVTGDGIFRVLNDGELTVEIPVSPLVNQAPCYLRDFEKPSYLEGKHSFDPGSLDPVGESNEDVLKKMISLPTIASKRWVYEQYDHMVRTNTVVLPGSDASVIRIKDTNKAIAISTDCNSRFAYLDPRTGGKAAFCEAARNLVCSGAEPIGLTDCLNFGNPEKTGIMWQFIEAVEGIAEACKYFNVPVVSGNVSFYNETFGTAINPTPTIGMVGLLDDINIRCDSFFKNEKDVIILLGITKDELGGSEYLYSIHGIKAGKPPVVDFELEKSVQHSCLQMVKEKLLSSAHDCSEGGLAVAVSECCFNPSKGLKGARLTISGNLNEKAVLFGESHSRIIVSAPDEYAERILEIASSHNAPVSVIGEVSGMDVIIDYNGKNLISIPADELENLWKNGFEKAVFGEK